MRLPDDARPTQFFLGHLSAASSSTFVWPADLLGIITCISGGVFAAEPWNATLSQVGSIIALWSGGGGTIPQPITNLGYWMLVNPGDSLVFAFNSDDISANCGFNISGWQYNLEG